MIFYFFLKIFGGEKKKGLDSRLSFEENLSIEASRFLGLTFDYAKNMT